MRAPKRTVRTRARPSPSENGSETPREPEADPEEEGRRRPRFTLTDDGNAQRFAEDHHGKLIYIPGPGWNRWSGKQWAQIEKDGPIREARTTARRIEREAGAIEDDELAKQVFKWGRTSRSAAHLAAMVKVAKAGDNAPGAKSLNIPRERLDHNLEVLNTPSGIVNLRDPSEVHENAPEWYCTRITRAAYDADADQAGWLRFLERFVPEEAVRRHLQLCLGASITGNVPKALFMLYGGANTVKSTLLEAILAVLGGYGGTVLESTLTNASSREAAYDIDTLRGARMVSFSETRESHGLAEERIKRLTGGDTVKARAPYGSPYDYTPDFSLWLATNHLPVISASSTAMWDRVRVFPFNVAITNAKERRDNYAAELAAEEGAGILAWLVEGAGAYYAAGRNLGEQPRAMSALRDRWRGDEDLVGRWLDEAMAEDPRGRVAASQMFLVFRSWLDDNNEQDALKRYTARMFNKEIDARGYARGDGSKGGSFWRLGLVFR